MNSKLIHVILFTIAAAFFVSHAGAAKGTGKPNKFNYKEASQVQPLNRAPEQPLSLWYNQPATHWEEALPIGNGRLGAMVYGGVSKEIIQLNEDSIWAGPPIPVVKKNVRSTIDEVRQLLFDGQYAQAQRKQQSVMADRISPRSYQTMGELHFDFGLVEQVTDYRRSLDLDTAVATTRYTIDGVHYTREVSASAVDDVIAIKIAADKPGSISFNARVSREGLFSTESTGDATVIAKGQAAHGEKNMGVKFATVYKVIAQNGSTQAKGDTLTVKNADSAVIYIAASTDYNRNDTANPFTHSLVEKCAITIAAAEQKGHEQLRADSVEEHQAYFRRVDLTLGSPSAKSTSDRLQGYKEGMVDIGLEALYFQYGRYLLIASSRPGSLPANLQGIWCKDLVAIWNSDYHININIQMNYWHAETTNLSECHLPFMDYIERLVPSGQKTAQGLYN